MKLSVIIPCYKHREYIEQCVTSVINQQTTFDFEVLVRDDYSKDGTFETLLSLWEQDPRVNVFVADKNIGGYENIKYLLSQCKGEYVAYIDGDDYYTRTDVFQRQVDFLDSHSDYVMSCMGSVYVNMESIPLYEIEKVEPYFITPLLTTITTEDLLKWNYVTFGRVFRNIRVDMSWMKGIYFLDWAFNFEISKYGRINGDSLVVGAYRFTPSGMITSIPQNEIDVRNEAFRTVLLKKYDEYKGSKVITIIDSFISTPKIEQLTLDCIQRLKSIGADVLLITNTKPSEKVLAELDYCVYDRNNRMFDTSKYEYNGLDLWLANSDLEFHFIVKNVQRHGLSVLYNIFVALQLAKSLGYSHFQRIEVDDIMSATALSHIKTVPNLCFTQGKKGLFYCNKDDISFHYFYSDIAYFLKKVPRIESNTDYLNFLYTFYGDNHFRLVEDYIFRYVEGDTDFLYYTDADMKTHFLETSWNTISSEGNLPEYYRGCTTNLYIYYDKQKNLVPNKMLVITRNFTSKEQTRLIKISEEVEYTHKVIGDTNSYMVNIIDTPQKIEVYDKDTEELLYMEYSNEVENWAKL